MEHYSSEELHKVEKTALVWEDLCTLEIQKSLRINISLHYRKVKTTRVEKHGNNPVDMQSVRGPNVGKYVS